MQPVPERQAPALPLLTIHAIRKLLALPNRPYKPREAGTYLPRLGEDSEHLMGGACPHGSAYPLPTIRSQT